MSEDPNKVEIDPKRGPLPGEFLLSTASVVGHQFHAWKLKMPRFKFPLRVERARSVGRGRDGLARG